MDDLYEEAIDRFRSLYQDALALGVVDPSVMALATADPAGRPSVRMVNLKGVYDEGFVFFTNHDSGKGRQLTINPRAALCFYWHSLGDQVIIEGPVDRLPAKAADDYWAARSRESKLAAWASHQSEPVASRKALKERYLHYKQVYDQRPVPRPEYWEGYIVLPDRIEFWRSGWHRLSERTSYVKGGEGWEKSLLNP